MDLFPAGTFVRLRNRARDKYVCADEDRVRVRLRSLRAARTLNAAWRVDILPADRGGDHFLLRGAAYGRCLAVAHEDEVVRHGYHGVRAVQRHRGLPHQDPPLMWTAVRVEADQNYVRLHNNEDRCLRANGRYCLWNKLVTVDVRNGDETTMMQWRVEAIQTLEQMPLPTPPPSPPRHLGRRNPFTDDWHEFDEDRGGQ